MQTVDTFLSHNPRYAKATGGQWEKIEPGPFAMSIAAGSATVCDVTPRGVREPGAWADEEFANAMLIADAKKNAALALLMDDLLVACARAEQDYRQVVDILTKDGRGCFPQSIREANAAAGHLANLLARAAELKGR